MGLLSYSQLSEVMPEIFGNFDKPTPPPSDGRCLNSALITCAKGLPSVDLLMLNSS